MVQMQLHSSRGRGQAGSPFDILPTHSADATTQQQRQIAKLAHPQGLPELATAPRQLVERILHDVLPADPDVKASNHAGVHPLEDGLQQQQYPDPWGVLELRAQLHLPVE